MKHVICFVLLAVTATGCATPTVLRNGEGEGMRLAFEARPCAGEVHLELADIAVVDRAGRAVPSAELRELPRVLVSDGRREVILGEFCEGCGGALRLHVALPAAAGSHPTIIVRGILKDGTPVSGRQPIVASDYN